MNLEKQIIDALSKTLRKKNAYVVFECLCGYRHTFLDGLIKDMIDEFNQICPVCDSDRDKVILTEETE